MLESNKSSRRAGWSSSGAETGADSVEHLCAMVDTRDGNKREPELDLEVSSKVSAEDKACEVREIKEVIRNERQHEVACMAMKFPEVGQ